MCRGGVLSGVLAAAGVVATVFAGAASPYQDGGATVTARWPGSLVPVRECHYSLAARVRPLLFWIGKDHVGEGRMTWLAAEDHQRGFEVLIGSLPDRAPRRINRWGYISERQEGSEVNVVGFMTEVDAETYEQAEAKTGGIPDGTRVYKIIHGKVAEATAAFRVTGLALPDTLTLRDLNAVAARVPAPDLSLRMPTPPGAEPGFLFAMVPLLRENVDHYLRTGIAPEKTLRTFVYANRIYEAVTRSSRYLPKATIRGRVFANVIESEFDARLAGHDKGGRFRVVYGTEGGLREVPVRVVYRPKWWFEADLVLQSCEPARQP